MKLVLLLPFILCAHLLSGQLFTAAPVAPYFEGIDEGSVTFVDIDGDNDLDLFLVGQSNYGVAIAKLYLNDGLGHLNENIPLSLPEFSFCSIAFGDIDGDNDTDFIITGLNSSGYPNTSKCRNQGDGTFLFVGGVPFVQVMNGSTALVDVDGDLDLDLFITGKNFGGTVITKLYLNDGGGHYSEVQGTPFEGVYLSSIAFADVDGDNDQDVLISGENNSGFRIAKLYANNGQGNYSEVSGMPFEGVAKSSIVFADVDNDNAPDVLITGLNNSGIAIAKCYKNDGLGNFSEMPDLPFEGVQGGSVAIKDVNGDNDPDVLITGLNNASTPISKLYINNGIDNFFELPGLSFEGVNGSSIALADIDSDDDPDIIIAGRNDLGVRITKFYANDGTGNFEEIQGTPFIGGERALTAFADIDGDHDLDVLITGLAYDSLYFAKLYKNDGNGNFTEVYGTPFIGVNTGSIAFADIDGDNDQDVLITGSNYLEEATSSIGITKLYKNDGLGNFSEVQGTPFEGVYYSSIAFADVDGDNDPDVVISGRNNSGAYNAKLFVNDGIGNFSESTGTPFEENYYGPVAFADVDGDDDQDLLIKGSIFLNDGTGQFTIMPNQLFAGHFSNIAFADVDGDNDQDVLIIGNDYFFNEIVNLYLNDGAGNFSLATEETFNTVIFSSISFGDVDGDNDIDVIIAGGKLSYPTIITLYLNNGMGHFSIATNEILNNIRLAINTFADVDGDGDQDLLIVGETNSLHYIAKLYLNNGLVSSTKEKSNIGNLDFVLYPNPTDAGTININISSEMGDLIRIKIFDATGRFISQQQHQMHNFSIDTSNLPKGAYFLQLEDGTRQGVRQFIVD